MPESLDVKEAVRRRYSGGAGRPLVTREGLTRLWQRFTIGLVWAVAIDVGTGLPLFRASTGWFFPVWALVAALLSLGVELVPVLRNVTVAGQHPFGRELRWWRLGLALSLILLYLAALLALVSSLVS